MMTAKKTITLREATQNCRVKNVRVTAVDRQQVIRGNNRSDLLSKLWSASGEIYGGRWCACQPVCHSLGFRYIGVEFESEFSQ